MQTAVATTLDPEQFMIKPHVAALDTFELRNDDGSFRANINESFLDRLIAHMNEREASTGDLAPLVFGHTKDGVSGLADPPIAGYARNWHKGLWDGRPCAFFDAWIFKDQVDNVRKFGSRRSCEIHIALYEVDPISLLGATTPARDLGLLLLSRDGSMTVQSPGDMNMADEKKEDSKPKEEPKETGAAKGESGKLDQILALLTQLMEALTGGGGGQPGGEPQMSDDEFNQMLGQQGGAGGPNRTGEPEPAKQSLYPDDTHARLSRSEAQVEALTLRLARSEVGDTLKGIAEKKQFTYDDALVAELLAMPPTVRAATIKRYESLAPARLDAEPVRLNRALAEAAPSTGGQKQMDGAAMQKVSAEALATGKSFEAVAKSHGYLN